MASYASVTKAKFTASSDNDADTSNETNTAKPVFIKYIDIFGTVTLTPEMFVTHVEVYEAIGEVVEPNTIKGIQGINKL